jgi:hypothetical protein
MFARGFARYLYAAGCFVTRGLVAPARLRDLVHGIPARAYARYPALTRKAVLEVVDEFVRTHPATPLK